MDGEDVFGAKISVEIAPTPASIYSEQQFNNNNNNGYQSPRAKKKLRKKRGSKADYHSSDGSGNSPQSSPQGSPKSSPYHQRSPGRAHFMQSFEAPVPQGLPSRKMALPSKPYSDLHSQFDMDTLESSTPALSGAQANSLQHAACIPIPPEFCNGHGRFAPATPPPAQRHLQDDPDPEMENLPWNQQQLKAVPVAAGGAAGSPANNQTRERHHSYTPSYAYKKPAQRTRTFSDPPHSMRQRTPERGLNDSPRTYFNPRQSAYSSQPNSPFRDARGRGFRAGGGGPGRRFSRSRSNSSNRSNQSSPSLSDSGDRFSAGTTSEPSYVQSSPTFLRHGGSDVAADTTPSHRCEPPADFHLRVTNLDSKKEEPEIKEELKKCFQRHAKVEDITIDYLADGSVVGIVRVSTLKAAERAIARLHRATKIGCKRIHVSLIHQPPTAKLRTNVVELLKGIPGHTLKWIKFVNLYEKRYPGSKINLSEVQQMSGEVVVINDEQTGQAVQLLPPVALHRNSRGDVSKPARWRSASPPSLKTAPPHGTPQHTASPQVTPTSLRKTMPSTPATASAASVSKEVGESDLCALHCPPGSPHARAQQYLPAVHLHRKAFAAQVHTLLLGHNGSMPLKSFMVCYLSEFPAPPPGEVPMEHLISSIPGVCITTPHSAVRQVQWASNTTTAVVPHLSPMMLQLAEEVTTVLSSVPRCTLAMSEFPPRYHSMCHKPCCFTDYGHSSLHGLMEALPHVVRIFGWGSWLEVSLTHAVQLRRFVSDLRTVLRSQPQWAVATDQLPNAFCNVFQKAFNVSDYDVCYIEDLLADLPDNVILVCHKDGVQTVELTQEEILLDLARSVIGLLKAQSATDMGLALPRFLSAYHSYHSGVQMMLSDYQVASVRELIHLIPDIAKIERKGGHDMIRLAEDYDHQLKVGSARQVLAAYPDPVMMGSDFVERYRSLYGERLDPKELHTILHGLAEVTQDKAEAGKITIRRLSAETIARNMCAILEIKGPKLPLDHLLAAYADTYGSAPLVSGMGFSSVRDLVQVHPAMVFDKDAAGVECVSLESSAPSDICGNIEGASKSNSSPELENAAYHLKTGFVLPVPKVNNVKVKPTSLLNKGTINAPHGLYDCDVAMNNCKQPEVVRKRSGGELSGLLTVRNKLAQSVVEDCLSVPPPPSLPPPSSSSPLKCKNAVECAMTTAAHSTTPLQLNSPAASDCHAGHYTADHPTGGQSCSRVASSRPGSRTASNSSGSPLGSPLAYPGTPRRNRMAAKFSNPCVSASPPLLSDSDV